MIYFTCRCGREIRAADHAAGTVRTCPACWEKIQLPKIDEARRSPASNTVVPALSAQAATRRPVAGANGHQNSAGAVPVSSSIQVSCECGKQYRVSEQLAGKKGKCTACGRVFMIPKVFGDPGELARVAAKPTARATPPVLPIPAARSLTHPSMPPSAPTAAGSRICYFDLASDTGGVGVAIRERIKLLLDEEQLDFQFMSGSNLRPGTLRPTDIEVSCSLTEFDFGNQAMRYFLTFVTIFGPGACKLAVAGHIRDAQNPPQEFLAKARQGIGVLGGKGESLMKLNVKKVASNIASKVVKKVVGQKLLNHTIYSVAMASLVIGLFSLLFFIFLPLPVVGLGLGIWATTVITKRQLPKRKIVAVSGLVLNLIGVIASIAVWVLVSK